MWPDQMWAPADLIVSAYPTQLPPYDPQLPPAERKRIRTLLLDDYDAALRMFDPRHHVADRYHDPYE